MALLECGLLLLPMKSVGIKVGAGFFGGSLLTLYMLFNPKTWEAFFRIMLSTYVIAVVLGGSLLGIYRCIPQIQKGGFILIPLLSLFMQLIFGFYEAYDDKRKGKLLEVEIHFFDGKIKRARGFLDTGNGLVEPVSKEPVSIIWVKDLGEYKNSLRKNDFRIIPFCSVGEEKGLMEGFFLKKLVIHTKEEEYVRNHAMLGITREKISSKQDYEIIIHPDMMKKVIK